MKKEIRQYTQLRKFLRETMYTTAISVEPQKNKDRFSYNVTFLCLFMLNHMYWATFDRYTKKKMDK